uniref:Uncharacterized protein n=1 Tax=Arundo donax TaxID=35708 RepID=A0A0A9FSG4_ARUDO
MYFVLNMLLRLRSNFKLLAVPVLFFYVVQNIPK